MLKKIIFAFQANFLVTVLNLIIILITSRYLGAAGRGYLSIIATYLGIIQLITGIIGPGTLPFLLRKFNYASIFFLAVLWSVTISIITTFLLTLVGFINREISIVFFLNAFTGSIFFLNIRMLISANKLRWYNLLVILQPVIILACLFAFDNNFNRNDFFNFQFTSYLIIILISTIILKDDIFKKPQISTIKKLTIEAFTLGTFNQLSSFTQLINYRLSFLFLEKFSGLKSVGIFSIILSIANVVWLFSTTVGTLIGEEMNRFKDNYYKGLQLINKYLKVTITVSLMFLVIINLLPSAVYVYILGLEFDSIRNYLMIFSPAILIFSISKVLAFYFSSLGRVRVSFYASVIGLIPTLAGIWLIKYLDIYGVIISTTLSFSFSTFVFLVYYFKNKKKSISVKPYFNK